MTRKNCRPFQWQELRGIAHRRIWGGGVVWYVVGHEGNWIFIRIYHREGRVLSFFFQSSELGLPHPLTRRRACPPSPPPLVLGLGHTHLRERGLQIPTRGHTLWYSVSILYEQYFVVCTISRWLGIYIRYCTCRRRPSFDVRCLDVGRVVCVKKISSQITQSFKGTVCVCILSNCDTPSSASGRDCCHAN